MEKDNDFSPVVSVIVPIYRAERYLDRCVRSILNQTETNIELWLIDDGSPDKCGNICDTFAQTDSRVHVIHKENAGVSAARNDGMKYASGKYVAFVDADDYIEPNMLSSLINAAEQAGAEIAICGYYVEQAHTQKAANLCCDNGNYDKIGVKQLLLKFFSKDYTGLASMCNKLYLRSFLNLQSIRADESLQRAEDFWFNFKAIEHSVCISVVSTPLYHYVQNEESVMHRYRETQFEDWTRNRERLLEYANEHKITLQYSDFYYNYIYNSVLFMRELVKNNRMEACKDTMHNPFFRQAIKHIVNVPLHIKSVVFCIKHDYFTLAGFLLAVWANRSGEHNV